MSYLLSNSSLDTSIVPTIIISKIQTENRGKSVGVFKKFSLLLNQVLYFTCHVSDFGFFFSAAGLITKGTFILIQDAKKPNPLTLQHSLRTGMQSMADLPAAHAVTEP